MDSRLLDMLMLISRVQEKRGDIRFMLRQDPTLQHEVHTYLDDLNWLGQMRPVQPNQERAAAGKEQLLAALGPVSSPRRMSGRVRILSTAASITTLLALGVTIQAARDELPQPVDQMINGVFSRDTQVKASPSLDLTTPAELVLESGPGFTN